MLTAMLQLTREHMQSYRNESGVVLRKQPYVSMEPLCRVGFMIDIVYYG